MSTRYSSDTNVHIDEDGFNTMIKWTFVGRGGKKSDSYHIRDPAERYSGMTDMKKTKESADKIKESADTHFGMTNMRTI